MNTDIPETVSADTVTSWSDDVDVVVIGFGIGGGCAAVSAAQEIGAGARVLVLERAAAAGGTTSLAGGHFYLGGGTAVQQATGHPDSPEEMYKYLVAVSRQPDADRPRFAPTATAVSSISIGSKTWVSSSSAATSRGRRCPAEHRGADVTPATRRCGRSCEQAKPAPRGHKVPVPGEPAAAGMVIDLLLKRAASLGVQVRYETGATKLIVDDSGVRGTGVLLEASSPKPVRSRQSRSSSPPGDS